MASGRRQRATGGADVGHAGHPVTDAGDLESPSHVSSFEIRPVDHVTLLTSPLTAPRHISLLLLFRELIAICLPV